MATIILSVVIFGSAAGIVYRKIKKGGSCEDCECSCPVKKESNVSD